jgi:antitoxin component YwqK of YwqJK toxin-antitoxin module
MKYLYLILLLLLIKSSFGQTSKLYVSNRGNLTTDSIGATGYVRIQKLSDTDYKMSQYDFGDTLLSYSHYKDEKTTIANGKFEIYQKTHFYNPVINKDSAGVFLQKSGYFKDWKKTGLWITFSNAHVKQSEWNYLNNKENGKYTIYYDNGNWTTGTMKNGIEDGTKYVYSEDSVLLIEEHFKNGADVGMIQHTKEPEFNHVFHSYMEHQLLPYKESLKISSPLIKLTVTPEGKIVDPVIIRGIDDEIDKAIIVALKDAPPITPAKLDDKATKIKTTLLLNIY